MDYKTYRYFPYSDILADKIKKSCEGKVPTLPAIAYDVPYSQNWTALIAGNFDYKSELIKPDDNIPDDLQSETYLTASDISESFMLTYIFETLMMQKHDLTAPITATALCKEYEEGMIKYRESCNRLAAYIAKDIENGTDLYSIAIQKLFGCGMYAFLRNLVLRKRSELAEKTIKHISQKLTEGDVEND